MSSQRQRAGLLQSPPKHPGNKKGELFSEFARFIPSTQHKAGAQIIRTL